MLMFTYVIYFIVPNFGTILPYNSLPFIVATLINSIDIHWVRMSSLHIT